MSSICHNCDLCRMDVGNKPKCARSKRDVTECSDYVHHLCRSCENMPTCSYVPANAFTRNYKDFTFIKKVLPTSRGFIITECENYTFVPDKPRLSASKAKGFFSDMFDALAECQRKNC